MDIARPSNVRQKRIRRALYGIVGLTLIGLITLGLSRLKPAAPSVERATVWIDTVKRGPLLREVRGLGTLVPEDIRWIPATTQGRVERILLHPGTAVKAESVILELSNPQLGEHQRRLQQGQGAGRDERGPGTGAAHIGADASTVDRRRGTARDSPRNRSAVAGELCGLNQSAARSPAVGGRSGARDPAAEN